MGDNGCLLRAYTDRSWQPEGYKQQWRQSEFTLDTSERQDISVSITSQRRTGRERRKKKIK